MVETTRAAYIPYSFGDLMEGRLRRAGDGESTQTQRGSAGAGNRADFKRDFSEALSESGTDVESRPAAEELGGEQDAALSDGELELRGKLAKVVGASASQVSVQEMPRQDSGRTTGTRQYIVTVDPPGSGGPADAFGVNHELSLPLAEDAADFDYDAISMVKDRLGKMGINASGIKFEYWTDNINNIGGHRSFNYLSADLGNGVKENFSLEWTLYNPDVTAVEIARLLKTGGNPGVPIS